MRIVVVLLLLVTGENKVNSYSDQLNLDLVCKLGVEFDKKSLFLVFLEIGKPDSTVTVVTSCHFSDFKNSQNFKFLL